MILATRLIKTNSMHTNFHIKIEKVVDPDDV